MIKKLLTFIRDIFKHQVVKDYLTTENKSEEEMALPNPKYIRPKTDIIFVHCAATPPHMDIGAEDIRRWHKEKGWRDIGYHDVIRRNGSVEQGRHYEETGAHVKGYNSRSIGVCLVGGVDEDGKPENNFTDAQFKSLRRVIRFYKTKYPSAVIMGHNEVSDKACPSFDVQEWLKAGNV